MKEKPKEEILKSKKKQSIIIITVVCIFTIVIVNILFHNKNIKEFILQGFSNTSKLETMIYFPEMREDDSTNEIINIPVEDNFKNIKEEANIKVYNYRVWDAEVIWKIRWNSIYGKAVKKVTIGYMIDDKIKFDNENIELDENMKLFESLKYIQHEKTDNREIYENETFCVSGISQGKNVILREIRLEDSYGNVIYHDCNLSAKIIM